MSYSASKSGRRYGSTFASRSPGRKPRRSPASTAGRVRMMRATCRSCSADRERHREVRLPGARRANPEGDRRATDRVDVALLRHRLRRDLLPAVAPDHGVEDIPNVLLRLERPEHRVDRMRPDLVPALDELDELVDHLARLRHVLLVAVERELVAAQPDRAVETVAQRIEDAVADPGQLGRNSVGAVGLLLNPMSVWAGGAQKGHKNVTHPG